MCDVVAKAICMEIENVKRRGCKDEVCMRVIFFAFRGQKDDRSLTLHAIPFLAIKIENVEEEQSDSFICRRPQSDHQTSHAAYRIH